MQTDRVIRRRVVVHGWVQGVFFRESVRRMAERGGVAGWVRNNGDGTVEAVFEGRPEAVESLLAWCRRGPAGARVDELRVEMEAPNGDSGFRAG